jgi:type IV secretory pathway ATPase VirB11/archaellum biosynthesis ATPase
MTTITATTQSEQDESLRELSADELDQIAGAWATTTGCASSTKYPVVELTISDITVGGVPTGGPPIR